MNELLGMICFILILIMVFKVIINRNRKSAVSVFLREHHIAMFCIMMFVMMLHAILAGYHGIATISGILCIAIAILICITYYVMKSRGLEWKNVHRLLAVMLLIMTVIHIALA